MEEEYQLKRDAECGFHHVWPTPDEETLRKLYSHEYYVRDKPVYLEKTARESDYWQAIWSLRLDAMAAILGVPGHVMDIGASGGFFLNYARNRGWRVSGIEPSLQSIAWAKEQFGLELFEGYLEDYSAETSLDAVHMSLVLEHVRDPRDFLTRALALLKPGGVIWVEVPNDFNRFQEVIVTAMEKPRWWVVPEHHLNYFDYSSLSTLLSSLGARVADRMASFPMELFVLMGLDYIGNDQEGARAHGMRMNFEKNMLTHDPETLARFYRALAASGLGRTCNILAVKN